MVAGRLNAARQRALKEGESELAGWGRCRHKGPEPLHVDGEGAEQETGGKRHCGRRMERGTMAVFAGGARGHGPKGKKGDAPPEPSEKYPA